MAADPKEFDLVSGEDLILDVKEMAVPFGWAVQGEGARARYDFSVAEEPGHWLQPDSNGDIVAPVSDAEYVPLTFQRFRHVSGDPAVVRLSGPGRVRRVG